MKDAQESLLDEVFRNNPIPMFIYDLNSLEILELNSPASRLYLLDGHDLVGKKVFEIAGERNVQMLKNALPLDKPREPRTASIEGVHFQGVTLNFFIASSYMKFEGRDCRLVSILKTKDQPFQQFDLLEEKIKVISGETAKRIIDAPFEKFSAILQQCLRDTAELINADAVCVFEVEEEQITLIGEWISDGKPSYAAPKEAKTKDYPWFFEQLHKHKTSGFLYHSGDSEAIGDDLVSILDRLGCESYAAIAGESEKGIQGFIRFLWSKKTGVSIDHLNPFRVITSLILESYRNARYVKELKESEQRYRWVTDRVSDLVIIQNAEGEVLFQSPSVEQVTGYTASDLKTRGLLSLVDEQDYKLLKKCFDLVCSGEKETCRQEFRLKTGHQNLLWHETVFNGVKDRRTGRRLVQSITRNIHERKLAELKSERDQAFTKSIADSFPGILYVYDLEDRKITYINKEVQRILGYTPEELLDVGDRFLETVLTAQDYYNFINRDINKYLGAEIGEVIEWNYQAKTKGGHLRWMHNRDVILSKNEKGYPKEIIGTALDVTEQRHREQEIRQKSHALEQIYDAVLVLSHYGELQYMNSAAERLFGLNLEDVKGKNIRQLSSQMIIGDVGWDGIISSLRKNGFWKGEQEVKTIRGHRTLEAISSPLTNENEIVTGILTVMRDISERKKAERELQKSVQRQEVLMKELHHRVKNNLQIMSSLLGMQRNNVDRDDLAMILDEAEDRIMTMALIHEQLYSSEDVSQVSLADYVQALLQRAQDTLLGSIENLQVEIETQSVSITLDRAIPIGLILNELISNTSKYAFRGVNHTPRISLELRVGEEHFELYFSDNGVGLPSDFNMQESGSLGHFLIQTLATQLDAEIEFVDGSGLSFRMKVPH